jgi:hypothetical protein
VGIRPGFSEASAGSRVDTHRLEGFSRLLEPVFAVRHALSQFDRLVA